MRQGMKIQSKSVVDQALRYLKDMIGKENLGPGQRIKEQEVSTGLGIGRPQILPFVVVR
jgi:DNA-binding GntR family transcriptional regulator